MSQSTGVVTYRLIGLNSLEAYHASVISANPTATALQLNCAPKDGGECNIPTATLTFGPWAQATPPSDASTGVYDLIVTMAAETATGSSAAQATFKAHCSITSTSVPSVCTQTEFDGSASSSVDISTNTETVYAASQVPITITAGYEKLAAASSTVASSSHASASGSSASSTASATSGSSSVSSSGTSAAATASHTGAASNVYGASMGNVGLLSLVAAFLFR
ncbi:hypothetical protein K461DRAFT_280438 [Myriangium duriaei CBS 260.36]|uniref:Uncharacterized protein n=1 Tax=Myriangium duriaei CBS 260.36 TaxID=1168546 RepID=A0A9P4IX30_9PEZI|nr:hypothetical protein K461DRAFT_280438 [Myriangium duriaei CBS 260.36]